MRLGPDNPPSCSYAATLRSRGGPKARQEGSCGLRGSERLIEPITGISRRRRWTAAEKAALVSDGLQPEVNISALARRHGINRGLLQTGRRIAIRETANHGAAFVPLRIEETVLQRHHGVPTSTVAGRSDTMALPGWSSSRVAVCGFASPVRSRSARVIFGGLVRPRCGSSWRPSPSTAVRAWTRPSV